MSPHLDTYTRSPRVQAVLFAALVLATATSAALTKRYAPLDAAPPLAGVDVSTTAPTVIEASTPAREIIEPAVDEAPEPVAAPLAEQPTVGLRIDNPDPADIVTPDAGATRYYNGRPIRPARVVWMEVTAYSPDEQSCGIWADGITASNKSVWTNGMRLVAADTRLFPFGTILSVPTYNNGDVVPVLDRGGAIKGKRLDVLYATHERAMQFGRQQLPVTIWEYADEG